MDLSSKSAVARLVLPHVPFLARTALWHTLYLSPTSRKWDIRTEITIKLIRAILTNPSPHGLLYRQQVTLKDPGIEGKLWISKVEIPTHESHDVLDLFYAAIEDLKLHPADTYTKPPLLPVEGEWTGYRPDVDSHQPRPDLSEEQHYDRLMSDTTSSVTLLYFHGGAFIVMDPCSHRVPISRLCRLTGGRALSVRYRLAPQSPFPAALLDAFLSYLSLLYPPTGSFHEAVDPKNIVLAGDSAGGNLSISLTQLLLQINRSHSPRQAYRFHRQEVRFPLPLPAGIATHSPWLDMTHSFPSRTGNAKYDYLPPPLIDEGLAAITSDSVWPANPPRGDLYCDLSMLCHPLVSPVAARDWKGAPPMFLSCGQEMLVDEAKHVAQTAARQDVIVQWQEWEGMCHCFGMVLVSTPMSKRFFADMAAFCRAVCGLTKEHVSVNGEVANVKTESEHASAGTKGTHFRLKTMQEDEVDVEQVGVLEEAEVQQMIEERMEERRQAFDQRMRKISKL